LCIDDYNMRNIQVQEWVRKWLGASKSAVMRFAKEEPRTSEKYGCLMKTENLGEKCKRHLI